MIAVTAYQVGIIILAVSVPASIAIGKLLAATRVEPPAAPPRMRDAHQGFEPIVGDGGEG